MVDTRPRNSMQITKRCNPMQIFNNETNCGTETDMQEESESVVNDIENCKSLSRGNLNKWQRFTTMKL